MRIKSACTSTEFDNTFFICGLDSTIPLVFMSNILGISQKRGDHTKMLFHLCVKSVDDIIATKVSIEHVLLVLFCFVLIVV